MTDLPYADGFFDFIIIGVDSYHYFGHEKEYLDKQRAPLLKKGGQILVGVPGLKNEFENGIPEELKPFYKLEYHFHTGEWWAALWDNSELIEDINSRDLDCHKEAWDEWLSCENEYAKQDIAMMEAEGGKYYSTVFIRASKK